MPGQRETCVQTITVEDDADHLVVDADLAMHGKPPTVTLRFLVDIRVAEDPMLLSFTDRRHIHAFGERQRLRGS